MAEQNENILGNPLAQDAIKGGIFFGTSLTPSGSFSNIPQVISVAPPTEQQSASVKLTLEELKAALQRSAQSEFGSDNQALSDTSLDTVITNATIKLLIDYRDIRNFVFFGSAYTELAFNINYLIANYPYKVFAARLTTSSPIEINLLNGGVSEVLIENTDLLFPATYSYREDGQTNWPGDTAVQNSGFDIVDELGNRFPVISFHANAGFLIASATNASPIVITTTVNHGFSNGDQVEIYDATGNTAANGIFYVNNATLTTFELYSNQALTIPVVGNGVFVVGDGARVRKLPLTYPSVYTIRYKVKGNISSSNFVDYTDELNTDFRGLIISPKLPALTDFQINLSPIQRQLLASPPINPTPWPREPITENIIISGEEFNQWLKSSSNFFLLDTNDPEDLLLSEVFQSTDVGGLTLDRASSLDETVTNQLIRRAVPHRLIDEVHDTEDGYFQRFILLAGQSFDIIKSYITFLRYTKTLNYTPYNQLSPEFYKLYAEHFGFDLFDDESIDLANLIVRTEPGLRYDNLNNPVFDDRATALTLKQLQNEQQKRLLINLFQLYRTKGTQLAINNLTALLGSPEGLFVLREYALQIANLDSLGYCNSYFNNTIPYTGVRIVDNDKVHVPQSFYEIDPDYLVNPNNINDPANFPYMYRLRLKNYETHNLREISVYTDPQNAILEDVLKFAKTKYIYGTFGHRSYANLQDTASPYHLLPLTFPDKYYGVTVEYMIPRDGYEHGNTSNEKDESNIHIGSLFQVGALEVQPFLDISNSSNTTPIVVSTANGPSVSIVVTNATNATPIVITSVNHGLATFDKVNVSGVSGNTAANGISYVNVLNANDFELYYDIALSVPRVGNGAYTSGGLVQSIVPAAPHGYSTGDRVEIAGVTGNTAANGIFTILVTSSTQFELVGSTGNGVYTGGGTARRLTPRLHPIIDKYSYPGTLGLRAIGEFTLSDSSTFPQTLTFAANTTPITINSASHGLVSGDRIRISGVLGNLAANGTYYIDYVNGNSFNLYEDAVLSTPVAGSGVYTSGGSYVRVSNVDVRLEDYPGSGFNSTMLLASVSASDLKTTAFEIVNAINFSGTYPEFKAKTRESNGAYIVTILAEEGTNVLHNDKQIYIVNSNLYPLVLPTDAQKQLQDVELISISNVEKLTGGRRPVQNGSFIINKLEGRDLVVRTGFNTEVNKNVYNILQIELFTPIKVTTAVPHQFNTNDRVRLSGVATSFLYPDVNGAYTITVTSPTTFTLNNTTGSFVIPPTNAFGFFLTAASTPINDGDTFAIAGVQFVARNVPVIATEFQAGSASTAYSSLVDAVNAHPVTSLQVLGTFIIGFPNVQAFFDAVQPGSIGNSIPLAIPSLTHSISGYPAQLTGTLLNGTDGMPHTILISGTAYVPFEERVAIYENFFYPDGLNHQLRLIYRARGVEVYRDFAFVKFLPWLDPTTATNGPFGALDIPREEILTCSELLFPVLEYASYPDNVQDYPVQGDEATLWDLFVGLPRSINFNFLHVGVVESQTINHPNVVDVGPDTNTGYESEVYSFQFLRQTIEQFNASYAFNIPALFRLPSPEVPGAVQDHYIPVGVDNIIDTLALHSHDVLGGSVLLEDKVQHYYQLPENLSLSIDSLFKFNAWHPSIHKNYTYDIAFGEAFRNYEVFSDQVLTYSALLPFLRIVEDKFKKLIRQFIPIVINVSDFGRIVTPNPFSTPKIHYTQIHDQCIGTVTKNLARGYFTISHGTYGPGVNRITTIDIGSFVSLILNIDYTSTKFVLAQDVANAINAASPFVYLGNPIVFVASVVNSTVVVEVDPNYYFEATGSEINDEDLIVGTSGDVTVINTTGFDNGLREQDGDDCFKVSRSSPVLNLFPQQNWIYYDTENGPETYVYFDSESIPPLFTSFSYE